MEKKISRAELAAHFKNEKNVNGTTFIGFDALTEFKLNKTLGAKIPNPDFGKIFKVLTGQVAMVFSNKTTNAYENMVNRRLALEGKPSDFQVSRRSWGTRIEGTPVIEHTNKEGEYNEYISTIYCESPVTLADYVRNTLGVEMTESDNALVEAAKKQVVAMESKSGKTEYVKLVTKEDGSTELEPIGWDAIQGKPPAKNEGTQGGLTEGMKVVPRDFKMGSFTRISTGGDIFYIED